jgi:nucleoside phosphorylase
VNRIVVTFAVPEEARPFRPYLGSLPNVNLVITGIGPRQAQTAFQPCLTPTPPSLVLSCGFAGALNPDLPCGTLVVDTSAAPELGPLTARLGLRPGRFHTVNHVLSRASEKAALRQHTGADAVEMESGAIRRLCQERQVPCAILRVISDAAEEDLPLDFNRYLGTNGRLHLARLAADVARSPSRCSALLRFRKSTQNSARILAEALVALIGLLQQHR